MLIHRRYRTVRPLGAGATATTYVAEDTLLDRKVALKLLKEGDPSLAAVLRQEFEQLRGLYHPHLVRVHDFGRTYYTADLVDGTSLARSAAARSWPSLRVVLADTLRALAFLHRLGIRHGDVKPENVLVDRGGRGVLIDLGCARAIGAAPGSEVAGTPRYLAPELGRGEQADGRADLYALGVMMGELLATCPDAPPDAGRVAQRLARDAAGARPADAGEVLEALGEREAPVGPPLGHAPRFLGQRDLLARFQQVVDGLISGEEGPRVLLFHGPEGSGRTRLLRELQWRAEPRCEVVEGAAALEAGFTRLLGDALGRPVAPGVAGALDAADLLRSPSGAASPLDAADAGPVVAFLDDADRLRDVERAAFDAWVRIAEPRQRLLLVGTAAESPLASGEALEAIALPPLAAEHVAEWAGLLLPAHRAADLHRLTGGSPGRIRAALARLASGEIAESELERAAEPTASPAGLAALSPDAKEALAAIAVRTGSPGRIEPDAIAPGALLALQRAGMVRQGPSGIELAHASDAAAIAEALGTSLVEAAHAAAARALDGREESVMNAAAQVRHLAGAGAIADAAERFERAGELHDREPRAWLGAIDALVARAETTVSPARDAATIRARDATLRPGTMLAAARVLELAGQLERALGLLARLLRTRPSADVIAACRERAGAAYLKLGKPGRALRQLSLLLAGPVDESLRGRASDLLSRALLQRGEYAEAERRAREALALELPARVRGALLETVGLASSYLGLHEAARRSLDDALRAGGDDPRARVRLLAYRAIDDYRAGRLGAAAAGHREALEIAERHRLVDQLASAAANLGTVQQQLGELGPALSSYERALRVARALGKRSTEVALRFNIANLFAEIGLLDRAETALAAVRTEAGALGLRQITAASPALAAEIALARGRSVEARAGFEQARAAFAALDATREVAEMHIALTEVAMVDGDPGRAEGELRAAEEAAGPGGADDLAARMRLARGRLLARSGRAVDALALLEEAERLARDAGRRLLEGEIAAALADALDATGAAGLAAGHRARAGAALARVAATLPAAYRDAFFSHPRRSWTGSAPDLRAGDGRPIVAPAATASGTAGEGDSMHRAELRRILEINQRLNSSLSADRVLEHAIDAAIELTSAERGFILLRNERGLSVSVARNLDRERIGKSHLKFSHGIAERVIASGEPIVTADARGDARFSDNQSVHAMRLASVACVPIPSPDGVLGAIYVDNRFERGRFRGDDTGLLLAFAHQVAIALRNARLHADLERRTKELEAERARVERLLAGQAREIDRLKEEVSSKQAALGERYDYGRIAGRSAAMRRLLSTLDRVIDSDVTVLIQGESGTGKELVARAIHYNGARRDRRFVSLNCAALPEQLLESELFGHRRGAFTGADRDREGLLVAARGGTLFLDEVGEMPLPMQAKLLRALQEREVRPVGATASVAIDVRIVSATNRDLRKEVERGRFREDLFYRLAVVDVTVPPLRDRLDDIPELVDALLAKLAAEGRSPPRLTGAALRALQGHSYPGNVRELENLLSRAIVLAGGDVIGPEELDLRPARPGPGAAPDAEVEQLRAMLRLTRWNVSEVSRRLGIPRNTLYRRLALHGIERPPRAG